MYSLLTFIITALLLLPAAAFAQWTEAVAFGKNLPEFVLQAPDDPEQRDYLGITQPTFNPHNIDAEVLLLELLNVNCPDCCMKVAGYNQLFEMLKADGRSKANVKLLGIAVGNSREEVKQFVEQWRVAYPVVADPRLIAAEATGAETTPFTILVRQGSPGEPGIVAGIGYEVDVWPEKIFQRLLSLARQSQAQLRSDGLEAAEVRSAVASLCTAEELQYRTRSFILETGGRIEDYSQVALRSGRWVYTAVMQKADRLQRLFVEVVAREGGSVPPYVYAFDDTGEVVAFDTLKPTETWTDEDLAQIRSQIVGRYLGAPLNFDREPAADPAAQRIMVFHDSLARGEALLTELQDKNLFRK